ncbi:MAG: sigma-70 family RNA polymerase sigma factor [Chloroflexi bacterium]|nr:sigma-70 family RNA polymerase sigma factor [Chloroflexota bacterium]
MDEKAAISAAQKGDTQAFNRLVLIYQGLAYNVAYRMLGDEDAAADATQDAFLSAYRAIAQFRGGSFKAWLLRIVTNACYDQLRHQQRRPATSLDDLIVDSDHSTLFEDERESPEHYAIRRELAQEIQKGLRTLPIEQRVTLILSDIQGLSYEEIAAVTGTSLGTVKSRLSRGRARLRDYLRETGELLPARYRLHSESPK